MRFLRALVGSLSRCESVVQIDDFSGWIRFEPFVDFSLEARFHSGCSHEDLHSETPRFPVGQTSSPRWA
jgi:hypothetical protein